MLDRRSLLSTLAVTTLLPAAATSQTPVPSAPKGTPAGLPDPVETLDLWPEGLPEAAPRGLTEKVDERSTDSLVSDRAVYGITRPRMALFRPDRPNGAAVLITPGGGYRWVVVDKEGYEIGRWLAARGYTAFVLFYRLPGEGWASGPDVALADAQRAMRMIRSRARDYGIDPERIGAMGFSAGGHVCADLAARFNHPAYPARDRIDRLSAKPIISAPIYPVVSMDPAIAHPGSRQLLLGANPTSELEAAHSPDRCIPADAPPHFIVHAADDTSVPIENSFRLQAALKARGIPVEAHYFAQGGHGFGLRKAVGKPAEVWPDLFRAWARTTGLG